MAVSFDKIEQQAPGLVSLAKKAQVSLEKASLSGQAAKVALCLDYSGSMRSLYSSGAVQRLAERVLALGTQFDDDGAIDVFLFDSGAAHVGELGLSDYQGGIDRLTGSRRMGTTNYAAAMSEVRKHFAPKKGLFRRSSGPLDLPVYVMFVTDGAPDSKTAATEQLVAASNEGIFWQFMGVGSGPFDYLKKLDESVKGRLVDNANFFDASRPDSLSDDELYSRMLNEFPAWIKDARQHGLIA